MALYYEVWTRPGHPNFGVVIDEAPTRNFGLHDGVGLPGDGNLTIPSAFDRFDDILYINQATPANSTSSLVRVFDDSDPTTPIFDWRPRTVLPTQSKDDPNVKVAGFGIKWLLNDAKVEAWDWDGSASFQPTFPDWIYGGRNILINPGFEDQGCQSKQYEFHINATGGTYTLSDGTDNAVLAHNSNEGAIEGALEGFAAIDDISVTPIPLVDNDTFAFLFEFINPCLGVNLTVDPALLTGGTATLTVTQAGELTPSGWMKSQQVSAGTPREYGVYGTFEPSQTFAHSDNWSLAINPGAVNSRIEAFAGAQQIVNVTPGGLYQASIWVRTTTAGQTYRLVIRGLDEDLMLTDTGQHARANVSPTANVWTQVTIPNVVIDEGTDQIIFRFASTNLSGNPAIFYIDDAIFAEGQAAATLGKILGDLYDDATTDHPSRIMWEDEANPGTSYLTLDFDDTNDSNGSPWADQEISIKLWMRMSYFQVMEQFAQTYGYEWRIVADDVDAGTWLWQVYNPDDMETDYTTATSPAIQGGSSDTRRSIQRVMPEGTHVFMEGLQRLTSRFTNTALATALGRVEAARLDRELPQQGTVFTAAATEANNLVLDGVAYVYELTDPVEKPLVAYQLGDRLTIHDPPDVDGEGRLADVEITVSPDASVFEVQFFPPL